MRSSLIFKILHVAKKDLPVGLISLVAHQFAEGELYTVRRIVSRLEDLLKLF